MSDWMDVCQLDDIEVEDVIRFDHEGHTYAVYRDENDGVFATDGLCTHGQAHLADGFVMDGTIECPKHNGRFDFKTGEATRRPACDALKTYSARLVGGLIQIKVNS